MNNKLFKLGALVVLTMLFSALAFAQTTWYVNSTNGDDLIYDGKSAVASGPSTGPFKTIAKAIAAAASGDIISIAAGTYSEANVAIGQNLTLVSTTFLSSNVVTITNGITISTAGKTINLGRTADGSLQFNLGSTANALVLTAGTLNIDGANVTVASGGTITRTAGTVSATPTVTNVNVTFTNSADIAAGPEMPAALGTGSLLISATSGKTITFSNPIGLKGGVTVTSGNATFGGLITFDAGSSAAPNGFMNSGAGTVTVNGGLTWNTYGGQNFAVSAIENDGGTFNIASTVTFAHTTTGASDVTGANIVNSGTGTLTIAGLVQTPATISSTSYKTVINVTNSMSGSLTFSGSASVTGTATNSSTGTLTFAGGTVSGAVTNASTGKIVLNANLTFAGNLTNNAGGTVQLNTFTLTFSAAAPAVDNSGSLIISATAATMGTGVLAFTGSGAATLTPGTELTGILINHSSASGGSVTVGAAATLYGDLVVTVGTFTVNGATTVKGATTVNGGTLALGTNNLTAEGAYSQTSGSLTFGANSLIAKNNVTLTGGTVTPGTGTLSFGSGTATSSDQVFTPIPNLTIYNFTVNNPTRKVTMGASLVVTGDFAITAGSVELSTYNIRMQGATKTFTNTGGYTSSGGGTLIWEAAGNIGGTGTFSNLDIRTGGATVVALTSNITFSGILYLRGGDLQLATFNMTFSDVLAQPQIYKSVVPAGGGTANIITGGGAIAWNASGTTYDLTYYGDADWPALSFANEWQAARLRNLTISTGTGTRTVTLPAGAVTLKGVLTVDPGQTLNLGTNTVTASGTSKAHVVKGTLSNGTFTISGASSSLTGSTASGDAAAVNNLVVSGASVSVSNIKTISGNLDVTGASASIVMNTTTAVISGNVTINTTNATDAVTLTMNATTSTHTGNLTITKGALTYTRGGSGQQTIGGLVLLTDGTLILGSSVSVTGSTTMVAGSINLQTFTYTQLGSGATPDFNRTGAGTVSGTGIMKFDATAAAIDVTPGSTFSLGNVTIVGAANGVTINATMTISGTLVHTSGTTTLSANLTFSGATFTFTAGGFAGTGVLVITGTPTITAAADMTVAGGFTINSTGVVTFRSSAESTPTARVFTSGGPFTQTAGDIDLGINKLSLTYIAGDAYNRTAGAVIMGTGSVEFAGGAAQTFKPGVGLSLKNLTIATTVGGVTNSEATDNLFTITGTLTLKGAGALTVDASKLSFADGSTIDRQLTTSTLTNTPLFGLVNVIYSGAEAAAIATAKELPATVVNLTINRTAGGGVNDQVDLAADLTVTGTLYLQAGLLDETTKNVTIGAGGTLKIAAGDFESTDAPTVTSYILEYSGGAAVTSKAAHLQSGAGITLLGLSVTGANTVLTPHAGLTVTNLTLNASGGGIALNTGTAVRNVTITGNLTVTAGNFSTIVLTGAITSQPKISFAGTAAQTATVPSAGLVLPNGNDASGPADGDVFDVGDTPGIDVDVNNSATAEMDRTITLGGGNLAFGTYGKLILTSGAFVTGSNVLTLIQGNNPVTNQPTQGFTYNVVSPKFGVVVGNVKKYVNNTTGTSVDRSIVTFPVGTMPASPGYYRPFSIYFKTAPQSAVNITVSHVNARPGGANGYPIRDGGLVITNYPNFYWYVKSDISLAPSYLFDMEAQAEGYTDYATDGIQNLRFVRRDSGLSSNQWVMQKNNNTGTVLYDNSTIAANWPAVKVIDATGGMTTQGSIFTYSQINKAPVFAATPTDQTVNEGTVMALTFSASDPDLGDASTMSAVTLPEGATFNASTGAFAWTVPYTLATKTTPTATATVKIRATDTYGPLSADKTITITINNVNRKPDFAATGAAKLAASTIKDGQALAFTYIAPDIDADPVTYVGVSLPTGATVSSAGVLAWTPTFAQAGSNYTITVVASDGLLTDTTSAVVTVNRSVALGDVDKNGTVQAADASVVLQHVAGLTTITDAAALWAADASKNGTISAFDAAKILQAAAGLITLEADADVTLGKTESAAGTLNWSSPMATKEADVVSVPLNISNSANVYAVQLSSKVDANAFSVAGVNATLPEGWEMQWNIVDNELRVAMAGSTPLPSGSVAAIMVRMKSRESRLNFSADAMLNETAQSLGAVEIAAVPTEFALAQNYPNPFNPSTTIKYQIANDANVNLVIYNLQGQQIRTLVAKEQKAGYYSVVWDGRNEAGQTVSSGLYLYRVQAGSFVATHKMLMIK
jgi:hypothetical protein